MLDKIKKLSAISDQYLVSASHFAEKALNEASDLSTSAKKLVIDVKESAVDVIDNEALETANDLLENAKVQISTNFNEIKKYAEATVDNLKKDETGQEITNDSGENEIKSAINKLQDKDKLGIIGEGLAATGGAIGGAAAASSIAGAAGATTLFGSTTLASYLGGVFVTTTPVGWVVGSALVFGAAGYGIAKLVRSGSEQDQVRKELVNRLKERLDVLNKKQNKTGSFNELHGLLQDVIERALISEAQAERMITLIEKDLLDIDIALERIKSIYYSSS